MERRSFLKLLAGGVAAVASGIKPAEAKQVTFLRVAASEDKLEEVAITKASSTWNSNTMEAAANRAMLQANGRGLLNSAMIGERMALVKEQIAYGVLKGKI